MISQATPASSTARGGGRSISPGEAHVQDKEEGQCGYAMVTFVVTLYEELTGYELLVDLLLTDY